MKIRRFATALCCLIMLAAPLYAQYTPPPRPSAVPIQPIPPKKDGVIRIGIAMPEAQLGNGYESVQVGPKISSSWRLALQADNLEAVEFSSALPDMECRQVRCDYILYTKVIRKKGGSGFLKTLAPMVAATAGGLIPGVGGIIGGMAGSAVGTATLAGGFKSKDEITFEYYLTAPDGKERLPKTTSKQKAKKDGEDVLTPQLRTAALTVIQELKPAPAN